MNKADHPRKKILFILQLPPPVHGSSTMNKQVVDSSLITGQFATRVIDLRFARDMREIEKFRWRKLCKVFVYAWRIVGAVRSFRPDLVYFTLSPRGFAFYRDAFYSLLLRWSRQRVVYHLHGKGFGTAARKNVIYRALCRWIFKKAHVICLSQRLTADVAGVYPGRPLIVPNGISGQGQDRQRRPASQPGPPQILYLSNYLREKGVLVLIDALQMLHAQGVDFRARLVGAPGDLSIGLLKQYLHDRSLTEHVAVTGPRYGQDKICEFQQADLFVFPTYYYNEAFPLVNLEAMQFGLPVISTAEGGIPDMLPDGECGFIVEARNSTMLADRIGLLLRDGELRMRMGQKGRRRFRENYTLAHFEENLVRVFRDLLALSGPQPRISSPTQQITSETI